ncbi:hypothetical protein [Pseudomonas huanghezhanensis]|uniref:hypothetical protein n=1 Tax=Pseudomonas huanghezhanensis TaxID=3002903 RepID=UPI002286AD36|nr:hypothetical protein [Pseudomonas sp. BSw22131]
MEVKNNTQPIQNPPAYLERKVDSRSTKFMQALGEAVDATQPVKKTVASEPAALTRLISPRASMELRSLNPVEMIYSPKPAALEKIGNSRVLPFAADSRQ